MSNLASRDESEPSTFQLFNFRLSTFKLDNASLSTANPSGPAGRTLEEIQQWIVDSICRELQLERTEVDLDAAVLSYGLDSMKVVAFMTELEDRLGIRFSENPLETNPSITELARHLAELSNEPN